jgi:hypothetical protein
VKPNDLPLPAGDSAASIYVREFVRARRLYPSTPISSVEGNIAAQLSNASLRFIIEAGNTGIGYPSSWVSACRDEYIERQLLE